MHLRRAAVWYVWFTPLAAMCSAFEKVNIVGLNYTGFLWASLFLIGAYLLVILQLDHENAARGEIVRRWWPWMIWFGFVWLSLIWCDQILIVSNIQDAMQLSMPLLVGMVAQAAIRTREDLQTLLRMFFLTAVGMSVFAFFDGTGTFERLGIATHTRAVALAATMVGGVLYAGFPDRKLWPLVGWGLALFITLITKSRMATAALLVAPILHLGYRSLKWNAIGVVVAGLLAIGIFQTDAFQERFFYSGSGSMDDVASGNIDDAGRFDAWEQIVRKSATRPLLGFGVGSTVDYVPTIWTEIHHCHNDYLRILFEQGWVGLSIYLCTVVTYFIMLWKRIAETDGLLRSAFLSAWLAFCMLLITSLTDNTIVYNLYYTDPLFAVLGAAYGVLATERAKSGAMAKYSANVYAKTYRGALSPS
jgi:O-antigen ligase